MSFFKKDRINLIVLLAFLISLNFHREWSTPLLILFLISSIFNVKRQLKLKDVITPLVLYFLTLSISLFYSNNIDFALKRLTQSLGLVLIPIGIIISRIEYSKHKLLILKTFVFSASSALLLNLIIALIGYLDSGRTYHFFYHHFSEFQHPSYFSLSLNLSMLFSSYLYLNSKQGNLKSNLTYLLIPFILLGGIILASSKTGIITSLLALIIHIYIVVKKANNRRLTYLISILSICLLTLLFTTKNPIQERFKGMIGSFQGKEDKFSKSTSIRMHVWNAGFDLISESPFLGYGIGDANKELVNKYENSIKLKRQYNAHNQYIQTTLETGLLGLIALLGILFYPLVKYRNIFTISISVIFLINLLTESVLLKQIGINLFASTYALMWLFAKTQVKDLPKEEQFLTH